MRAKMRERTLTVAQAMEIVMAVIILAAIVIRAILLVIGLAQELGEDPMSFPIDDFLSKVLLVIMGIEFVHISKDTTVEGLEKELFWNDLAWKLK